MKKIYLFLLLTSSFAFSQYGTFERGGFSNVGTGISSIVNYSNLSDGIKGNKYFTNSWAKGTLVLNDSIFSAQSKIQYDLVTGEVLINTDNVNNTGFIITDRSLTGFQIFKDKKINYFVKVRKNDFVDYLVGRDFLLNPFPLKKEKYILINFKKKLIEPKATKSHYSSTKNHSEYIEKTEYFILNKDNKFVKIKLKKRHIIKALGKEAKELINKHELNVKELNELYKLLELYHS